jgi:hypothetical protein
MSADRGTSTMQYPVAIEPARRRAIEPQALPEPIQEGRHRMPVNLEEEPLPWPRRTVLPMLGWTAPLLV